jgi:transcriptional regulator with XRE-family HTH domain
MARARIFNGGKARELRKNRNIELLELVDLIGENPKTGKPWHRDTLTNIELGHHQPSLALSHAWAEALNVSRSALLMDAPEQDDTP